MTFLPWTSDQNMASVSQAARLIGHSSTATSSGSARRTAFTGRESHWAGRVAIGCTAYSIPSASATTPMTARRRPRAGP